jgi:DNA mismatch repair protein MutS2
LFDQTTDVLEWEKLLSLLAAHTRSTRGAALVRLSGLAADLAEADRRQRLTTEMARLQDGPDPPPVLAFPDVEDMLGRVGKGAVLETHELRDHAVVLALWDEVQRYLARHADDAPALVAVGSALAAAHELRGLRGMLEASIQPDGSIRESATPELRRLTHHANDLKQQIRRRLEDILQSARYEEALQERYFAEREGRYVVPIKIDMQRRVPGIVHDVSASGATVFLEPRELVDLNNAIKVADREIDRAVSRRKRTSFAQAWTHLQSWTPSRLARHSHGSCRPIPSR